MTHARRAAALVALALVAGCATNPVTGERELMLVSKRQEEALGRDADREIVAQFGLYQGPALQRYVEDVGHRLVAVSHRPNMTFTFRILDDPVVNAFALPGGYVYLTRGILAYLQSEGAMTMVLGHEVGHVTARHGAQRLTRQQLLGLGIGITSLLGDDFALVTGIAAGGGQLLLLKYDRDQERQSDQLGVTYGTRAGFDTTDGATFFSTLQRLSGDRGALPSWFSTHPDPGERHDTVRAQSQRAQAEAGLASYQNDKAGYLRRLQGLPFGPDPQQGFLERGWVNHPAQRWRAPVPGGWTLHTQAGRLQLAAPDGARAVLVGLAKEGDAAAAASAFAAQEGVAVRDRSDLTVGGFPAARVESTIRTSNGEVAVLSTFIAREGRVHAFHGLAEPADLPAARATLLGIAEGFQALTDPRALSIQPAEVHIVEAPRTGTFRSVVRDWPVPEGVGLDVEGLAILNGVGADETVTQGTLLKVLRRRGG
ncbi:MAG: M48 family metalloprotease [Planctomycetes bacterium]|nr:M48 family metalloprotease [Planctomycetota bacterium]